MNVLSSIIFHGLIYSVVLSVILNLSQIYNPRIWIQNYPKDIQQKVNGKTKQEKKLTLYHGIPFLLFMFLYPPIVTYYSSFSESFTLSFYHIFGISFLFNITDLVVLDWLLFSYITPKYLVIPGTKGMKSYKNYSFHLRGFYIGTILSILFGLLSALVVVLI